MVRWSWLGRGVIALSQTLDLPADLEHMERTMYVLDTPPISLSSHTCLHRWEK